MLSVAGSHGALTLCGCSSLANCRAVRALSISRALTCITSAHASHNACCLLPALPHLLPVCLPATAVTLPACLLPLSLCMHSLFSLPACIFSSILFLLSLSLSCMPYIFSSSLLLLHLLCLPPPATFTISAHLLSTCLSLLSYHFCLCHTFSLLILHLSPSSPPVPPSLVFWFGFNFGMDGLQQITGLSSGFMGDHRFGMGSDLLFGWIVDS